MKKQTPKPTVPAAPEAVIVKSNTKGVVMKSPPKPKPKKKAKKAVRK